MNKQIKALLLTLIFSINVNADDFILGGWTQHLDTTPPSGFSHVQYGMITELNKLTIGTVIAPGWGPADTLAPKTYSKSIWSYGGALCRPAGMPNSIKQINNIISATTTKYWDGVDVDNECGMDINNVIKLFDMMSDFETSYTFMGGVEFNDPEKYPGGQATNDELKLISDNVEIDRFIMMSYGDQMWSEQEIKDNIGPGIVRLLNIGIDKKNIIVTVTTAGLTNENLHRVLDEVVKYKVGGLFVWEFKDLIPEHLIIIQDRLQINY